MMTERDTNIVDEFVWGTDLEFKVPSEAPEATILPPYSFPGENTKMNNMSNKDFPVIDAGTVTESALLRLRTVIGEAKSLCLFLRTSGYQREVERAFGELASVVGVSLSVPPQGLLSIPYASGAGGGRGGDAAALGGEEAAPASGVVAQESAGMDWNPGMHDFQRIVEENIKMPNFEKELVNVAPESSSIMQNGFTKGVKGKKVVMGLGSDPDIQGKSSVDKLPGHLNEGACKSTTEAKLSSEGVTFAFVEFKRGRIRRYASVSDISPGKYVIVDGDRGQDCGLLVQTIRRVPGQDDQIVCMEGTNVDENRKLEEGSVIRSASEDEVRRLHTVIANAESVALKTCRERCYELCVNIEIVDVEYQFDMNKVTFFFDSNHSVDFRSLVRELYRSFGARIWMENINPSVRNSMHDCAHYSSSSNNLQGENGNWSKSKKKKSVE